MPRPANSSDHSIARLRVWFGLQQEEVARLLEVSTDKVRAWEKGQRNPTIEAWWLLQPLLLQVPADARAAYSMRVKARPDELPHFPAGEADELDFRRRECWHKAIQLRLETGKLAGQLSVAQRWALALPALQAAYADPAFPGGALSAEQRAWVELWLRRQTRPVPPEVATRWHLLRARIAGCVAEAEALTAALGTPPSGKLWELFQQTTELGF
jgi:transcriptional regulator with XRE-family HTH domain